MDQDQVYIDFSFLDGLSVTDDKFKREVINIFLANAPGSVARLDEIVRNQDEWEEIYKQAHYLKSSFSVIKISNINDLLQKIEQLAKKETKRDEIEAATKELVGIFEKALPILIHERDSLGGGSDGSATMD
jgi:HPt (histidine-containing phosphotransfer) domain-containing protein